ncbi:unnamed protein product [Thelazia callipaeda]|uniref:Protein quiver n=1 Tax=Thelazia callipaeda TaxID=103827 RepID=A0A0N5D1U4_THECL|nr:unnamed protein product [Thelazia callipaeda]
MLIVWFSSFTLSSVNGEKSNIKCYACTNIDTKSFFDDVQAWDLKNWLETTRFVSKTKQCEDKFNVNDFSLSCNNGLCMKMLYTSENGKIFS